jgi:hypothetical protein
MFTNLINNIKQTVRIFTKKDFDKNPNAPHITELQKKALWIGLINSEQITAYCDSLTTGLSKERITQGLTQAWGVYSRDDALETIKWIQEGGHRAVFNAVLPYLHITDEDERNRQIETKLKEDLGENYENVLERLTDFARNLRACISGRGNHPFVAFNETNINKGILAWDLGRFVIIIRMCYDMGYLDETTAWDLITSAFEPAIKEFADWHEVAASYLIGRGAWGGDTIMLDGLYTIAQKAFENDNSPWKNVPLK